jgi:SRSO17 transposase
LNLILQGLAGRAITLIIDDTGDRKKGHHTDYFKRQCIGNLGKVENGIVAVTAYGVVASVSAAHVPCRRVEGITIPLTFEIYKPKECLKAEDIYKSKPEIAAQMIRELQALGFSFSLAPV